MTLSETTECSARAKNFILWFAAGSMHFNIVWHFLALFFTSCTSYNYFQQLLSFLKVFPAVFPIDQWSCGLATAVQTHCCRMSFIRDVWQLHLKVGRQSQHVVLTPNPFFSAKWNRESLEWTVLSDFSHPCPWVHVVLLDLWKKNFKLSIIPAHW